MSVIIYRVAPQQCRGALESPVAPILDRSASVPKPRVLLHSLHNRDLFVRQSVQLVHELVDLPVGQLDLALNHGALRGGRLQHELTRTVRPYQI